MDFLIAISLAVLTIGQILCIVLIPILDVILIIKLVQASFCNLTVAEYVDCTYIKEEKKKRDYENDYEEYHAHFFSPDVIVHHKAYKWVTFIRYLAQYRYVVDGQEFTYIDKGTLSPEKLDDHKPEQTIEVFYNRNNPKRSFSKSSYLGWVFCDIGVLALLFVINLITKGMKIVDFWAYFMVGFIYLFPFLILFSILKRKATN